MSTAAVMLVKDEADVIGATVGHLLAHVDEVIVADNLSGDGTREILEQLPITLLTDSDPAYYQAEKTTRLAQRALAAGHQWVVPCDADEIWQTPGRIADALASLPPDVDVAVAWLNDHVPTDVDDPTIADPFTRMGWRQVARGGLPKVACRLKPDLRIHQGNHGCTYSGPVRGVDGLLSIRHFPYRSVEQMISKARNGGHAYKLTDLDEGTGWHWRLMGQVLEQEGEPGIRRLWESERLRCSPGLCADLTFDPVETARKPSDARPAPIPGL